MPEAGNMNLSLKIAGGGYDDFFPYELHLEEGFSRVYRAQLTVFTKTRREQKDLRELLERNITLGISQRIAGSQALRQRYLHGLITSVASLGVVSRGGGADCYRHVITIESALARLSHTRLTCPYYKKTPPEIVTEILSRYEIPGDFSDKYVDCPSFSANLMFEQVDISDLGFIHHLLDFYGILWTFVHGKVAEGSLGTAELNFTEGFQFPQPVYEYSDKRKIGEVEQFDFLDYNEAKNIWKMDTWTMDSGIGVEGLEVSAPYPQAVYGSQEWRWGNVKPGKRYHNYNTLFHGYERKTPQEEIDADIKRTIEAKRIALYAEKEIWKGSAENTALMPGLIFELRHFQGAKDNAAISALVTDSRLHVRSVWPRDMAAPPAGPEPGELAQAEFSAVDWGKDSEKRFCRIGQCQYKGKK